LIKCGAFVGDGAEIGANTVLNPGSVIGKNTRVYPLNSVRGYVDKNSIYKSSNDIIKYLED
jgi:UDP-3-O-[3-hydroxymyristoyl] glucosamine N-acyltransferase